MDLKEFISATLSEIQEGVQSAINETIKNGTSGAINPHWGDTNSITARNIEKVEFDIALTVSEKVSDNTGGKAKASIKVLEASLGGDSSSSTEELNSSRVKFSIPIIPPVTTINN